MLHSGIVFENNKLELYNLSKFTKLDRMGGLYEKQKIGRGKHNQTMLHTT